MSLPDYEGAFPMPCIPSGDFWYGPATTRDWYLIGDHWDRGGWAVHARERIGAKAVAVVSVNFSVPRDKRFERPVKVKASPKTCELEAA